LYGAELDRIGLGSFDETGKLDECGIDHFGNAFGADRLNGVRRHHERDRRCRHERHAGPH
jgi:hypothetical protein